MALPPPSSLAARPTTARSGGGETGEGRKWRWQQLGFGGCQLWGMLPLKYEQSPSLRASEFKKGIFDAVSLRKVKDEIVQNDAFYLC